MGLTGAILLAVVAVSGYIVAGFFWGASLPGLMSGGLLGGGAEGAHHRNTTASRKGR